ISTACHLTILFALCFLNSSLAPSANLSSSSSGESRLTRATSFAVVILELRDKASRAHKALSLVLTARLTNCRPASVPLASQPGHSQSPFQIAQLPHSLRPMCAVQARWCLPKVDRLVEQVERPWPRCGATHPDTSPATTPDYSGPKRNEEKSPRLVRNAG